MPVSLLTAAAAIRPDPGQARSWVERELSRPPYHRGLLERLFSWLGDLWDGLTQAALGASPLSTGVAVVIAVAVAAFVVLVAGRVRRDPLARRAGDTHLVVAEVTPDEHRERARAALAGDGYDEALVEAFRALASRSLHRGLVDTRPGLTAHELATDLAPAFPAHAEDIARAAGLFDVVFYGDEPADGDDARWVLDLDEALRTARPGRPQEIEATVPAVPR